MASSHRIEEDPPIPMTPFGGSEDSSFPGSLVASHLACTPSTACTTSLLSSPDTLPSSAGSTVSVSGNAPVEAGSASVTGDFSRGTSTAGPGTPTTQAAVLPGEGFSGVKPSFGLFSQFPRAMAEGDDGVGKSEWETSLNYFGHVSELNYLTHIVCRLYERLDIPADSDRRVSTDYDGYYLRRMHLYMFIRIYISNCLCICLCIHIEVKLTLAGVT